MCISYQRRFNKRKGLLKRHSSSSSLIRSSSIEVPATEEELAQRSKDDRHDSGLYSLISQKLLFCAFYCEQTACVHDRCHTIGKAGVAAVVAGDSGR